MSRFHIPLKFFRKKRLLFAAAIFAFFSLALAPEIQAANDAIKNSNQNQLTIYGIVTRALLYAEDGERSQLFQVDGSVENTRFGWIADGRLTPDITVQGHIEMDAPLSNAAGDINLNGTENADRIWGIRIQVVSASHRRFGKLSLGQGDTASTDRVGVDLSGSGLAVGNNPADMAGGIHFYNKTTGARTVKLGDVFDKIDGIDKDDRLRFDFPEINGLSLAVSHTSAGAQDIGAGYARKFGGFEFEAGAYFAFISGTSTTDEALWGGAGSIKHSSGLSFTLAGASKNQKVATRDDANYLWWKIGYSTGLFSVGKTHFGGAHGQYNDFSRNGDEATSTGFGIVQDIEPIGSNLWLLVRNHELKQASGNDFDDVFIVSLGTLINF